MGEDSALHVIALVAFVVVFMSSIGHALKDQSLDTFWSEIKDTALHPDSRLKTQISGMSAVTDPGLFSYVTLFCLLYLYFYIGYLVFLLLKLLGLSVGFGLFLIILLAFLTLLPVIVLNEPFDFQHSVPVLNGAFSGLKDAVLYLAGGGPAVTQSEIGTAMNNTEVVDLR
jgi:hypothetical protein